MKTFFKGLLGGMTFLIAAWLIVLLTFGMHTTDPAGHYAALMFYIVAFTFGFFIINSEP